MIKRNQDGMSALTAPLIISIVLLLGAIVFGGWAYSSRQTYKNDVDSKINAAVVVAKQQQTTVDDAQFAIANKTPLQIYNGPEASGRVVLYFPKTWSGYVDDTGNGAAAVDGYFSPGVIPALNARTSVFAMRMQVQNQTFSSVSQSIVGKARNGVVTAQPYALPKVPKVVGLKVVGRLPDGDSGTEVILPVRSQTIVLWTDGTLYLNDFNNYILPNFSFSP